MTDLAKMVGVKNTDIRDVKIDINSMETTDVKELDLTGLKNGRIKGE